MYTYVAALRLLGGDGTADGVLSDLGDSLFGLPTRVAALLLRAAGTAAAAALVATEPVTLLLLFVVLTVDMRLILLWLFTLLAADLAPLLAPVGGYSCANDFGGREWNVSIRPHRIENNNLVTIW